ncbi:hypothetical protein JCM8115_006703 [Rhodotorula mucilaginosa]|uniref:Uncharacterized protein n=1 Tax=Rhodotorula mucilaginosa TaxID=5537 RepID=A0A9P6W7L3_RHOMI|nr:hypothetical protein C6P46_004972 [Rhodotorula mucilaginosa]TKA54857.1 hypothetical protein B0A53_02666 [Rhodotorula sp. CCFEE 5036]
MPVLDAYNYSLLSVPAVWLLGIGTHWSAIYLSTVSREIPKFDNVSPRQYVAEIAKLAKTSKDARQLCRTEAAQQNIFENIGLYAAAIVAGNVARLGTSHMNKIALGYLVSRFLYVVLYIRTDTIKATPLRSVAYLTSVILSLGTFIRAGLAFNRALY